MFLNAKCEKLHLSKRNPRKINWTVLYRRKHKKGISEEVRYNFIIIRLSKTELRSEFTMFMEIK